MSAALTTTCTTRDHLDATDGCKLLAALHRVDVCPSCLADDGSGGSNGDLSLDPQLVASVNIYIARMLNRMKEEGDAFGGTTANAEDACCEVGHVVWQEQRKHLYSPCNRCEHDFCICSCWLNFARLLATHMDYLLGRTPYPMCASPTRYHTLCRRCRRPVWLVAEEGRPRRGWRRKLNRRRSHPQPHPQLQQCRSSPNNLFARAWQWVCDGARKLY